MNKKKLIFYLTLTLLIAYVIFQEIRPSVNIQSSSNENETEITLSPNFRANAIYDFSVKSKGETIFSYKEKNKWPFSKPFKFKIDPKYKNIEIDLEIQYDYWIAASIYNEKKKLTVD